MHNYLPMREDKSTVLWSTCFVDDEDIEYVVTHRFNALYTETTCTNTFELISKMFKKGYLLEIIEKENYFISDGKKIPLKPHLYAKFIYREI